MRPFGTYHRPFDIIIKMQANKHLSFGDSQNITLTKSKYNLQSKYNFGAVKYNCAAIRTAAAQKNTPESVFLEVVLFCRIIFRRIR